MLFNSLTYIVFMLIAAPAVLWSPLAVRRAMLLAGSLLFYAFWRVDFTLLVVFSALIDYMASLRIYATEEVWRRRCWLAVSLTMNLGLLIFFKYTYFIVGTTQSICSLFGLEFEVDLPYILLPLGISFYTFQTISYTIDVYRHVQRPTRDFPLFLTYVTFWPQLVAGPVLRAHEVLPQLAEARKPHLGDVVHGLEEILHGMFKKVVLADTLAGFVDYGFGQPMASLGPLDAWSLCFAFGMQIYFDFSGYSQIAIGSARLLGFHFPRNFNWPYLACSPRDFWKRWHISLSSWISDYLYLPLQGAKFRGASTSGIEADGAARASEGRRMAALFATWFIMGLWHGANWTFVVWGLWHAVLIAIYRITGRMFGSLPTWLRVAAGWLWTTALVMLGWAFFRAQSVADGLTLVMNSFNLTRLGHMSFRENDYLISFIFFSGLLLVPACLKLGTRFRLPLAARLPVLTCANAVMLFGIFISFKKVTQFIYFQF